MNEIYTISMLVSIAVFILVTHITPGPTNIILLSSVLNFGYKKSIPFMLGCIVSYPLMMILTGFGIGIFLIEYPNIMLGMKIVGVIYLCWMAWKIAQDNNSYESDDTIQLKPFKFVHAFIYTIFNPKAWVIYTTALSLFVTSSEYSFYQIGVIVVFILISMIITVYTWTFGGIILKKFIKNKKLIKRVNLSMSFLLIASIIPIII